MRARHALLAAASLLVACQDGASPKGAPAASASAASSASAAASSGATRHTLTLVAPELGLKGEVEIVESWFSKLSAMFAEEQDGERVTHQATMVRVYLSDGPMQPGHPMSPGQTRVYFSLTGKKGTGTNDALEPGTYDLAAEHFERVAELRLEQATDDPKRPKMLVLTEATGTVKLMEHTQHRVTGEIDAQQGDMRIQGHFSATPMPSGIMKR